MQLLYGWRAKADQELRGHTTQLRADVQQQTWLMGWDSQTLLVSKFAPTWLCMCSFSPVTTCSSDMLNRGHEAGFHPCSEHCLMCSCNLPWSINAVCRFAPETVRDTGSLSSNVCELLIHHRVKSRTHDLNVLECHCLCLRWLRQHRKTYLAARV